MTQEEKELLLKDLCARLPYGANLYIEEPEKLPDNEHISVGFIGGYALNKEGCQDFLINDVLESLDNGSVVKPYLRPLSSMTEEEKIELCTIAYAPDEMKTIEEKLHVVKTNAKYAADFYNEHHFDHRGLIPIGLALEAPEGMYKND